MIQPFLFKSRAMRMLKGNWQTALLVSFFAALPMTAVQLMQTTLLPDLSQYMSVEAMMNAVADVPQSTYTLISFAGVLSALLTPVLSLGCNHYFVCRMHREELGFGGLFSRFGSFGKALWLYIQMYVRAFLWGLLLVVPGIIALIRYSMAPYYLAENPSMTASEALAKSKETMRDKKMNYFWLELSFVGWMLMAMVAEFLLYDLSVIAALVASQFIQLFMATYLNASIASFYLTMSVPGGAEKAQRQLQRMADEMRGGRAGVFGGEGRDPFEDEPSDEDGGAADGSESTASEESGDAESGAPDESADGEAQPDEDAPKGNG